MNKEDKLNIDSLLKTINILREKIEARKAGEEKFNIFTCLRKYNDEEKLHSRFISSIIDVHGSHGLGVNPLDNLIRVLDSSFKYEFNSVEVHPNASDWSEYRDIDILLIDRDTEYAVIIENKIFAGDSNHEYEGQLEKYYREILQEGIPKEHIEVYYLTLDGHDPTEESVNTSGEYPELSDEVRTISYGNEIINWLNMCIKDAALKPIIRETLVQYLNLIKEMTTNDTEVQDRIELIKLISKNEDNLKSAKFLLDNQKHIQWHTTYDLFNDFTDELKRRGFKDVTSIDPNIVDRMVHYSERVKKQQHPQISFKEENGVTITIYTEEPKGDLRFGINKKNNESLTKSQIKAIREKLTDPDIVKDDEKCPGWVFNCYFDVKEDHKINIWDFSLDATFRLINSDIRKVTVKEHIDDIENNILKPLGLSNILG